MSKRSEFFQCLICNSFFESVWKVETHVKGHNEDEKRTREGTTDNRPRRRGMLPIQKRTFYECYVPVVKNQIDPDFLAKYENVLANDGKVSSKSARKNRELSRLGVSEDLTEEDILNSSVNRPRRENLHAKANIRKAAAVLTVPDRGEQDDDDRDQDYIESLREEDSQKNDDKDDDSSDYEAYFCKKGRKRGRPLGSYTVTKDRKPECKKGRKRGRPLGSYTVTKDPEKGRNIGRPFAIYTLTNDRKPKEVKTTSSKSLYKKKLKRWIWDGKDHPFKCKYCLQSFPKRMMLTCHILREHKDVAKTIDCPISICNKTCVNYLTSQYHVRYHLAAEQREEYVKEELKRSYSGGDKEPDIEFFRRCGALKCQYCLLKIGFSLEHLEKHKKAEHGENVVLKCPGCKESFQNSVADLISHVRSFHPSCMDPYDERFRRAEDKELELRFKCDNCAFKCKHDYQLKKHEASHENGEKEEGEEERPFKCPSCNKAFKYKHHLRRHFMLHLENNPFVCGFPNCNRKFSSDCNLRRHKLLHSQSIVEANRVYCPICRQCVSRKDKLAEHMKNKHKPEDIVNGIPVASSFAYKRRQVRMPILGFGRYKDHEGSKSALRPTNNQAEPSCSSSVSTSKVQEQNSIVKSEQMEEIHLIDKILLTENGTAIHIKGEHLSPQKISEKKSTNNIKLPRLNCQTVDETFFIPVITPINITQLITNDPIFKTLDPKSAEVKDILPRSRNYHNVTGSKSFTCVECNAIFSRA